MNSEALHSYVRKYPHVRVRNGGGHDRPSLLNYDNLRPDLKKSIFEKYGDIRQYSRRNRLQELIEPDLAAASFFSTHLFEDGSHIIDKRQAEYSMNATILNACGKFLAEARGKIRSRSGITSGIWNAISAAVNSLDPTRYPHDLPSHPLRLQEKYKKYIDQGYHQLIHKGNKNSNATKRTPLLDNLIISLYCDKKLPFGLWVLDDYLQFISGNKMIVDQDTAVIYDRADFYDQARGKYINISESTVWNILNEPIYKPKIDRLRNNRIDHITQKTPHNHRHSPNCSMAKISMDDRTFSRKTAEGLWLNAYVAYEVASQCVLSTVYSTDSMATKHVRECSGKCTVPFTITD